MRWVWEVTTDEKHVIVADAGVLGSESVWLDGKLIYDKISWKFRNEHVVPLKNCASAKVIFSISWMGLPRARFCMNDKEIPSLKGKTQVIITENKAKMPAWVWLFIVLCGLIPIFTRGGALPVMIVMGGVSACAAVSKNKRIDTLAKVMICLAITIVCWAITASAIILTYNLIREK